MSKLLEIVLLLLALYGVACILWELNERFLRQKNRNTVSYLAFLPLGDEDSVELEIRSTIDYAQEMGCEPVILVDDDWSREKMKIASIIAKESDIKTVHMKKE